MQTLIKKRDYKGLYKNAIRGKTKKCRRNRYQI